ncbi:MAG: hypothetical protein LBU68_01830, partial [Rickettsiales bacterium]|nr:hypothetical protein [Rickettsiales bacterium]
MNKIFILFSLAIALVSFDKVAYSANLYLGGNAMVGWFKESGNEELLGQYPSETMGGFSIYTGILAETNELVKL